MKAIIQKDIDDSTLYEVELDFVPQVGMCLTADDGNKEHLVVGTTYDLDTRTLYVYVG